MLANKLASSIMPAIAIREVVEEAYAADPEMIASAACDIQAVRTRDPAVDKYSTPLLYLKGFHALQAYRIGHWLWNEGRRALAIFLQNQVRHLPGGYPPGGENWPWDHARPRHRHCGR
jgi:serine O-acetyltransferase